MKMTKSILVALAMGVSLLETAPCFAQSQITPSRPETPFWKGSQMELKPVEPKPTLGPAQAKLNQVLQFTPVLITYKTGNRAQVPFEWINGEIVITVAIDGHANLKLIVDTGVTHSALDAKSVEAFGFPRSTLSYPVQGIGSERLWGKNSSNLNLALEGLTMSPVSLLLVSGSSFTGHMGTHVDGYLGYDILKNFVIKLDYLNKTIDFMNPGGFDAGNAGKPLPVVMDNNRVFVTAVLQNNGATSKPTQFLMDTGCNIGMVLSGQFFASNPDISFAKGGQSEVGAIGGTFRVWSLQCSKVYLGDVAMNDPFTETMVRETAGLANLSGLLGNQVWKHFDVTIDFPGKRMFLKENGPYDGSYQYIHAGPD